MGFKFITVSVGNLHFRAKKYSTVLEATTTCKQITKSASTLGEMILGLPERRDDNKLGDSNAGKLFYDLCYFSFYIVKGSYVSKRYLNKATCHVQWAAMF